MKSATEQTKKLLRFVWVFYSLFFVSVPLYVGFLVSPRFADWFNGSVSPLVRGLLAHLTNLLPCSLAELLLILSPLWIFLLFRAGIRKYADTWRAVGRFCLLILSAVALVLSLFTLGFAPAYRGSGLDEKLGIERRAVSKEELYETAVILAEAVNQEAEVVLYEDGGFSVMPYDFGEMNDRLLDAYKTVPVADRLYSRLKPVLLSKPMSYTHITGVYTFFTGEANLNVYFPDYTLPFTAAHELAHQRGIAREDEANFMAFLACQASEYSYIRYSGYLNLFEYVAGQLWSADPELYRDVYAMLLPSVRGELRAYSEFFDQFRDSVAGNISESVNDTFLTIHGTEGVKSYGMVVDLAVAYFIPTK